MAEVLASLKKIGGSGEQYTETVLWTNPDPTSNFTGQNVTLSDSLSNYKYIGIRFAYGTSYKTGEYISTLLETVADFRKFGYGTGVRRNGLAICISDEKNKSYERLCIYVSDTSVHFDPCNQVASSTQANGNAVPLEILGINELAHAKGLDEITTLWTNSSPTSSFATQTITLSDEISDYDFIKIVWAISTSETSQYQGVYFIPADTFANYLQAKNRSVGNLGMSNTSDYAYTRNVFYASDTSIKFGNCYRVGTTTQANTICIPISVIGCRFK